jgi:hypothetical protein
VQQWPGAGSSGEWHGAQAEELHLGNRATVAATGGTQLKWDVARGGDADVTQARGSAFYRVEKGGAFVVHTPGGDVTVQGTSFGVDILDGDRAMDRKSALVGAAGGALMAAAVLVTVYEGRVALASPGGDAVLTAGQAAVTSTGQPPRRVEGRVAALEADGRRLASERDSLRGQVEEMEAQIRSMTLAQQQGKTPQEAENAALREQLKNLRAALAAERAELAARSGETVAWPKDLSPAYKQDGLQRSFTEAIKAAGLDGEIKSIDCTEFPCLVYGKATHHGGKEMQAVEIKKFEEALHQSYPEEGHSIHESVWSQSRKAPDGSTELVSTFGVSIYPKDSVDEGTGAQVRKRVRFRQQQYMDGEQPN